MTTTCTRIVSTNQFGRDLVVGDVHGCFRTLHRALREVGFDPDRDRLFGVGDLVNRGPHSEDALAWIEDRFHSVTLGNHKRPIRDWFRAKLLGGRPRALPWLRKVPSGHSPGSLGVPASAADAQARREQWMSSRGSCIGYKGGRAGREAVHTLVRGCPSRSLARAVIGV